VGVIGPTRMDYQRVIPLVSLTAQVLSRVFNDE
jgi:heat-inducible transcriptional repressor